MYFILRYYSYYGNKMNHLKRFRNQIMLIFHGVISVEIFTMSSTVLHLYAFKLLLKNFHKQCNNITSEKKKYCNVGLIASPPNKLYLKNSPQHCVLKIPWLNQINWDISVVNMVQIQNVANKFQRLYLYEPNSTIIFVYL